MHVFWNGRAQNGKEERECVLHLVFFFVNESRQQGFPQQERCGLSMNSPHRGPDIDIIDLRGDRN